MALDLADGMTGEIGRVDGGFNVVMAGVQGGDAAPLLGKMEGAHYAAALAALALMGMGYLVWKAVQRPAYAWARALAPAIPVVYVGALYVVYTLAQA